MSPDRMMDTLDRRIVNALQDGLPLIERPYASLAAQLEMTEDELVTRLRRLAEAGTVSRIGPLYNAERMGGAFVLAALSAPEAEYDAIAQAVNAHPEVAHNYARAHPLNMWFVLATEREGEIAPALERIERAAGCEVLVMRRLREYVVRLKLDATERAV